MQSSGGQVWVLTAMCVVIIVMSLVALVVSPETRNFALDRDE
jgi:hypothetical protein